MFGRVGWESFSPLRPLFYSPPFCFCLKFLFLYANERSHIDLAFSFMFLWQQHNYKALKAEHFYPCVPLIIRKLAYRETGELAEESNCALGRPRCLPEQKTKLWSFRRDLANT
ncbi:hypothetical protein ILYODFUR_005920 [Ilyodon furcidens]|uniref:Uncharacterized protein n=1 Tax=Ilyodon furcidens TaxID=33524 RepID=A0ABV0UTB8_9TELE